MSLTPVSCQTGMPMLIDAAALAMVIHHDRDETGPGSDSILFIDRRHGAFHGALDCSRWNLDPANILDDIARSGCTLIPAPLTQDGMQKGTAYINPAAFQSAIVSTPFRSASGAEDVIEAHLDIEGHERLVTTMTPQAFQTLVGHVAASKPGLIRIAADSARPCFRRPVDCTFLDLDQLDSLSFPAAMSVRLAMEGGTPETTRKIDLRLPSGCPDGSSLEHMVLRRMSEKARALMGGEKYRTPDIFGSLVQRSERHAEKQAVRLMDRFCKAIAQDKLLEIEKAISPCYVRADRIEWAYCHDNVLQLLFAKPAFQREGNDLLVRFRDAATARKSYAKFVQDCAAKPSPL